MHHFWRVEKLTSMAMLREVRKAASDFSSSSTTAYAFLYG